MLNDRWTDVLAAEEYGLELPTKSYSRRKLLPQFDDEAPEPILPKHNATNGPDRPPRGQDRERQLKLNTLLHHPTVKVKRQQLQDTLTTYNRTWIIEPVRPDQYRNQGVEPQREKMAIKPGVTSITSPGLKPHTDSIRTVVTWPDGTPIPKRV